MKKNILTFIILTLCVANLTLTAILMFAMLPSFNKTNKLITQVTKVLDLELEKTEDENVPTYDVKDLEVITLSFASKQTINLAKEAGATEDHYVLFDYATVSINTKSKDAKRVQELITKQEVLAKDKIVTLLQSYTINTLDRKTACDEAVRVLNEFFNTDCIAVVTLEGFMFN
jgi:flagellar FliL protein